MMKKVRLLPWVLTVATASLVGWLSGGPGVERHSEPARVKTVSGERDRRSPVVVIGLDGASWRVLRPLIDRGAMPVLGGLERRGVHGTLWSIHQALSPVIWTTIATGVRREKHGVKGFLMRVAGRPLSTVVPVGARRVPAIWNVAGLHGLKVGVVGWWVTWPAEPVDGFMVSHTYFMAEDDDRVTHPASLLRQLPRMIRGGPDPGEELARLLGRAPKVSCVRGIGMASNLERGLYPFPERGVEQLREAVLCRALAIDAATVEISRVLSRRFHVDLLLVYLRGIDFASHFFWKHAFPKDATWRRPPTSEELASYGKVLDRYYRYADRLVGRLLEGFSGATVLVVSDHGFGPDPDCGSTLFDFNLLLSDLGYLAYKEGRIDWRRTVVVHDGQRGLPGARLYLNLRERSPQGIVATNSYRRTLEEITARLRQLRTRSGRPVVIDFKPNPTLPARRGDPNSPDLLCKFNSDIASTEWVAIGRRSVSMHRYRLDKDTSGRHASGRRDELAGVLVAAGPGVRRQTEPLEASVLDVAPTLACILGIRLPTEPDGRSITGALEGRVLRRCKTPAAPPARPRGGSGPSASPAGGSERRDERLRRQLRSLGYIQ